MIIVGKFGHAHLSREGSQKSMDFSNGDRLVSTSNQSPRRRPERPPPPGGNVPEVNEAVPEKKDPPTTNFFDTLNWQEENAPLALDSDEDSDEFNIHAAIGGSNVPTGPTIVGRREDSMDEEFAAFTSERTMPTATEVSNNEVTNLVIVNRIIR